jgi:hypothetical protein
MRAHGETEIVELAWGFAFKVLDGDFQRTAESLEGDGEKA